MSIKDKHINYFNDLENVLKETLVIYTDLLNELDNKAVSNKLYALAIESMDDFKLVNNQKQQLI
ncbi:MAG: hypothetical protein JSV34_03940 [Candidatus Omnitrophota bacterium]|nr:MAG: hypothetical protein JSV34_03940 [Candidatus Omnitrophota bacterium]